MKKILFICLGNICRSPMAEFVMKDLLLKDGLSDSVFVSSAATSDEEEGNPVYPPVASLLRRRGIDCSAKRAVQLRKSDYDRFDLVVCMESRNVRDALRIFGGDPMNKVRLLLDFTDRTGDIADPYYTRDFELTYRQVAYGCQGLLAYLKRR